MCARYLFQAVGQSNATLPFGTTASGPSFRTRSPSKGTYFLSLCSYCVVPSRAPAIPFGRLETGAGHRQRTLFPPKPTF